MADQPTSGPFVTVSRDAVQALSEPTFIIQMGDVYYITVAVLEYHPEKASTDQHRQGLAQVAQAFGQGQPIPAVVHTAADAMQSGGHTSPD